VSTSHRYAAIDYIKALAIVGVVIQHAGPNLFGLKAGLLEQLVRQKLFAFHVPSFLIVSGFLYCRSAAAPWREVGRRLSRIVVPYLVVSVLVVLLGFSPVKSPENLAFRVATGGTMVLYYFIWLLAVCIVLIWPFSRMSRNTLSALLALLCIYSVISAFHPELRLARATYWTFRNPVHHVGYFLTGWLAALYLDELRSFARRHRALVWGLCALGIAAWLATTGNRLPGHSIGLVRTAYTLAIVTAVALLAGPLRVPSTVRVLSESSLTIYLYHPMVILALLPSLRGTAPGVYIPLLTVAGLGVPIALALLARRGLGERSKLLVGA
jgi:peptidoglycan/LPS O-acetylase OafA/YrhL